VEEIAAEMQMSLPELQSSMAQIDGLYIVSQRAQSQFENGEVYDLIESAPAPPEENPFEIFADGERKQQLASAIASLSDREQLILSLYYKEELTMREVAEVVGIAVSRVSQIHAATLKKLRAHLDGNPPVTPSRKASAKPANARSKYECFA
jgi:RNA polymerase sigma factor for flagellar operon FliA